MPNPAALIPGVLAGLTALEAAVAAAGIDGRLLALSRLRASQINGCGPDVAAAARRAREQGVTGDQVDTVAVWREAPWFRDEERAVLALTEAVTRVADRDDPVPDRVWDVAATHLDQKELAALVVGIALTNAVNRLSTSTRQQTAK
jgi:AhpD family alkylhydroperoxidase